MDDGAYCLSVSAGQIELWAHTSVAQLLQGAASAHDGKFLFGADNSWMMVGSETTTQQFAASQEYK